MTKKNTNFVSLKMNVMIKHGKYICNALKAIRLDIARANGIEYAPKVCHHEGECAGTCPACESEMRYLEREIARKRSMGKAAFVAGVSLALSGLSATATSASPSEVLMSGMSGYRGQSQVCDTTQQAQIFGEIHETMPHFRGGEPALMEYLQSHIKYPPEAVKDSIQGLVVVQLLIERNGEVNEVKVVRSVHELLDNEAIRVCKSLPKFFPGRVGGKAAAMWLTLPVTFKMEGKSDLESTEDQPK